MGEPGRKGMLGRLVSVAQCFSMLANAWANACQPGAWGPNRLHPCLQEAPQCATFRSVRQQATEATAVVSVVVLPPIPLRLCPPRANPEELRLGFNANSLEPRPIQLKPGFILQWTRTIAYLWLANAASVRRDFVPAAVKVHPVRFKRARSTRFSGFKAIQQETTKPQESFQAQGLGGYQ